MQKVSEACPYCHGTGYVHWSQVWVTTTPMNSLPPVDRMVGYPHCRNKAVAESGRAALGEK
jgi:hypothetical protein